MTKGMVTGTTGENAIEAGVEILKKGGSACDAGLATAMAQIAMAAGSWVSYAGILNMVYFEAKTGKVHNLNGSFNSVKAETDPLSIPGSTNPLMETAAPSGRTALVPGFMAAVDAAHKSFGSLPLSDVFAPAIKIAEEGYLWSEGLEAQYNHRKEVLNRLPETAKIFADKPKPGEAFKQPYLAKTLKRAVKEGVFEYFYKGEWAEKLVAAVQADGGKMTLEDLRNYQVIWQEATHASYGGYDIHAHGSPAEGGVNTAEALNIMAELDFANLPHYSKDPQTLAWLTHLLSLGYGKMSRLADLSFDDRDFDNDDSRLSKPHAQKLAELIRQDKIRLVGKPMTTPAHSDAVVTIDKDGNICAICHSINCVSWGGTGIFVDGISISDAASFQQAALAEITPGERLPDPTALGLVVKDGRPFMGFSSIGNGLHHHTVSCLHNVLDHGYTPQEAIDAPALGGIEFGPQGLGAQTVGVGDFDAGLLKEASRHGLHFVENDRTRGYWIGIQIDDNGQLSGGSVRGLAAGGRAVGY